MKKLLTLLMSIFMATALVACSSSNTNESAEKTTDNWTKLTSDVTEIILDNPNMSEEEAKEKIANSTVNFEDNCAVVYAEDNSQNYQQYFYLTYVDGTWKGITEDPSLAYDTLIAMVSSLNMNIYILGTTK